MRRVANVAAAIVDEDHNREDGAAEVALAVPGDPFPYSLGPEVDAGVIVRAAVTEEASARVEEKLDQDLLEQNNLALVEYSRSQLPGVVARWGLNGIASSSDCKVVPGPHDDTLLVQHNRGVRPRALGDCDRAHGHAP